MNRTPMGPVGETSTIADDREIQTRPAVQLELDLPDLWPLCSVASGMSGHALFLFNLACQIRARHVVEIGLGGANSATAFLLAMRTTGGSLTSVDVRASAEALERVRRVGGLGCWRLIEQPSDEAVNRLREMEPVDILLIDGDHSYAQCRRDYFRYSPLVRPGGYVLFHDSSTIRGVIDFTRELLDRGLGGINLDYCNGLFVFHKTDDVIW